MTSDDKEMVTGCATLAAALIVTAYAFRNPISPEGVTEMLANVRDVLAEPFIGSRPEAPVETEVERPTPAQIRKSITPDGLVSFLDGKTYQTLKRHLTRHGLDPQGYRARFGLPPEYPMTAPSYSAKRSALAKQIGLGAPGGPQPLKSAA